MEEDGVFRLEPGQNKGVVIHSSHLHTPKSSRSEKLLYTTSIGNPELVPKSASDFSPRKSSKSQNIRIQNQPRSTCRSHNDTKKNHVLTSSTFENCSSGQSIQLVMTSTSKISKRTDSRENSFNITEHAQNSVAKTDMNSTVRREYQLLAQKFHQYTINCRTTIRALEKKLKKLIDDKHALLHGMVSMRKGQKDVVKKYRKIFNDAMNVSN